VLAVVSALVVWCVRKIRWVFSVIGRVENGDCEWSLDAHTYITKKPGKSVWERLKALESDRDNRDSTPTHLEQREYARRLIDEAIARHLADKHAPKKRK